MDCVSCGIGIDEGDLCEGCDKFLKARKAALDERCTECRNQGWVAHADCQGRLWPKLGGQ